MRSGCVEILLRFLFQWSCDYILQLLVDCTHNISHWTFNIFFLYQSKRKKEIVIEQFTVAIGGIYNIFLQKLTKNV